MKQQTDWKTLKGRYNATYLDWLKLVFRDFFNKETINFWLESLGEISIVLLKFLFFIIIIFTFPISIPLIAFFFRWYERKEIEKTHNKEYLKK